MKSNNPQLAEMFSDYVKTRKYVDSGWKSIAGNILAFIKDEPVMEPGLLTEYVVKSQGDKARDKDIILDFFDYYEKKTGEAIENDLMDMVIIDNTFLRRIEILKYLHEHHTTREIASHFGVSPDTITADLNAIREGFDFFGTTLLINDESTGRERRKHYRSNVHPVLLALNSTEIIALTVKLMQMAEKEEMTDLFDPIIYKIYAQLSDYAKEVLVKAADPGFSEKVHEEKGAFRNEEEWIMDDGQRREAYSSKMTYLLKSGSKCDFVIRTESGMLVLENGKVVACEGIDRYMVACADHREFEPIPVRVKNIESMVIKEYKVN